MEHFVVDVVERVEVEICCGGAIAEPEHGGAAFEPVDDIDGHARSDGHARRRSKPSPSILDAASASRRPSSESSACGPLVSKPARTSER